MLNRREFLTHSLALPALVRATNNSFSNRPDSRVCDPTDPRRFLAPGEVIQVVGAQCSGVSTLLIQACLQASEMLSIAAFLPHEYVPNTEGIFLKRMVALKGLVATTDYIQGHLEPEEERRVEEAKESLRKRKLFITGSREHRTLSIEQLSDAVHRIAAETDLRLLALDGLEFIHPVDLERNREPKDLQRVGRFLQEIAEGHQISIIVGNCLYHRPWRSAEYPISRPGIAAYRLPEEFCPTVADMRRVVIESESGEWEEEIELRVFRKGHRDPQVLRREWDGYLSAVGPAVTKKRVTEPSDSLAFTVEPEWT